MCLWARHPRAPEGADRFAYLGALHGKCAIYVNMCGVSMRMRVSDMLAECGIKVMSSLFMSPGAISFIRTRSVRLEA